MARRSGKSGPKAAFKIAGSERRASEIRLDPDAGDPDEGVSISLKHYRREAECFSDWSGPELKKFALTIGKLGQLPVAQLRGHKALCAPHRYDAAAARFSWPDALSRDLALYEIKVDPSNKARIHGVFKGAVFFLIWLDRHHAVFPS